MKSLTNPFSFNPFIWHWPLSGDVKDISPTTTWFSPQYETNLAGDSAIEKAVVTQVASYGKQLGKITQAVLELADGEPGDAIASLRKMADDINAIKQHTLAEKIEADLMRLKQQDNAAYEALLKRL